MTIKKRYSKENLDLFNNLFSLTREYDIYYNLIFNGYEFIDKDQDDKNYNTTRVLVSLQNGCQYVIEYGEAEHAEELAFEAFDYFINDLNYDELAFELYLEDHESFRSL